MRAWKHEIWAYLYMAGISRPETIQRAKFMLLVKEKKKNVDGRHMDVAPKLRLVYIFLLYIYHDHSFYAPLSSLAR